MDGWVNRWILVTKLTILQNWTMSLTTQKNVLLCNILTYCFHIMVIHTGNHCNVSVSLHQMGSSIKVVAWINTNIKCIAKISLISCQRQKIKGLTLDSWKKTFLTTAFISLFNACFILYTLESSLSHNTHRHWAFLWGRQLRSDLLKENARFVRQIFMESQKARHIWRDAINANGLSKPKPEQHYLWGNVSPNTSPPNQTHTHYP